MYIKAYAYRMVASVKKSWVAKSAKISAASPRGKERLASTATANARVQPPLETEARHERTL